ncbi:MAG: primosomal protein N' [Betaproteobacteria bacterium]|nr:primosomal protein N' [Betaproteobacteria bacterium]
MTILRVALDVPVDELFDYTEPPEGRVTPGELIVVPFGRRRAVGVVVETAETTSVSPDRLKSPLRLLRHLPALPADFLHLASFCSRYYAHPLGATLHTALPTALRRTSSRSVNRSTWYVLTDSGRAVEPDAISSRSIAQRSLLALLRCNGTVSRSQVETMGETGQRWLREFLKRGWVQTSDAPASVPDSGPVFAESGPMLVQSQQEAVARIAASLDSFAPTLLHGVTGSGKTEVYLRVIEEVLSRGRQALLLVPEINLTPQLEARVSDRFGRDKVVALHSHLADGERCERWLTAARGEAAIVIGTRLAVFTPMPRLGLIVVDEEHDPSYKQQEGLRYHARDVAIFRAREKGIPVVLGSATPSMESWRHASTARYVLLRLPQRPRSAAPVIRLVDCRDLGQGDGISPVLGGALARTLERGEQSLVFLNRRGYAPTLFCHACGWVAPCSRCSARLTVHLSAGRLRCHYCGHEEAIARHCPSCGNQDLLPVGAGTQRLEAALAVRLPGARIARVDRDSTRQKDAFNRLRDDVEENRLDILVGTQMLAKGHDFPRLTLVGVVDADAALLAADFRAEERLFALLLQVSGRAGRAGLAGEVLVQTRMPDHPLYAALVKQDYAAFAEQQLVVRERMSFPPFSHQVLLRAEAGDESAVFEFLDSAAALARQLAPGVSVYDPVPAWMAKLAGKWRGQLLVQSAERAPLHRLLRSWIPQLQSRRVRWSVDVDPLDS